MDRERIERAYEKIKTALLAEQTPDGYWVGELSSSALATATAIGALALVDRRDKNRKHANMIQAGLDWLLKHRNEDGAWGDTIRSHSNISTTILCLSAFHMIETDDERRSPPCSMVNNPFAADWNEREKNRYRFNLHEASEPVQYWLMGRYGAQEKWPEAVRKRYGKDRTFSVPILTMASLAGIVKWNEVPRLPFELACIPQKWYRYAKLPVVSYALPALIAIGQCVHHHRSKWNPLTRFTRWIARKRSLKVLRKIQPTSGGYLEATPLTAFVTMSLASLPRDPVADEVIASGVKFLEESMRPDGSWPIDTNLSTWVTTLAVNAFAAADDLESLPHKDKIAKWLLDQQGKERHPYTGADPGGWAWTPLSGGVPDCDDTPGALLALREICGSGVPGYERIRRLSGEEQEMEWDKHAGPFNAGYAWCVSLQNSDGGYPTFCKGWGVLPFDRSGADLTAHVLRVASKPIPHPDPGMNREPHLDRAFAYLKKLQREDGSWLPLWFGNQFADDDINPVYGTAKVLAAYRDLKELDSWEARRGLLFIKECQNPDGGWGGATGCPSSVEETSLAVEILFSDNALRPQLRRGLDWLCAAVERDAHLEATPIGFYFAKLWYFEKLYPLVFALAALGKARKAGIVP